MRVLPNNAIRVWKIDSNGVFAIIVARGEAAIEDHRMGLKGPNELSQLIFARNEIDLYTEPVAGKASDNGIPVALCNTQNLAPNLRPVWLRSYPTIEVETQRTSGRQSHGEVTELGGAPQRKPLCRSRGTRKTFECHGASWVVVSKNLVYLSVTDCALRQIGVGGIRHSFD
jgi:hypothetical protein